MDRKPQDQDKFVLRLPDGMRDRIKAIADANSRSMNAEIISTLDEKYPVLDEAAEVKKIVGDVMLSLWLCKTDAERERVVREGRERLQGLGFNQDIIPEDGAKILWRGSKR